MSPATVAGAEVEASPAAKNSRFLLPILAFGGVLAAVLLYVSYTGLVVFMGDSYLLANRAKHLADELNLNLDNGISTPLIYPPLYPILIAFAYRFQDPRVIFRLILFLNASLTASQVFPLRLLLERYGKVSQKNAWWLAVALALSPASLPYSSMVLTDVLYCPVVIWLAYFVNRAVERGRRSDFAGVGLMLALSMLTRSAATVALLACAIAFAGYFWRARNTDLAPRLKAGAISAVALVALYGAWSVFERFAVKYEGFVAQFQVSNVIDVFFHAERFDLHMAWFTNCLFYYLTAPLSLAGAFVFVLFVRKPALLRQDITAVFFLASMLVGAGVASFVTADRLGGLDVTWNRYIMPYVVLALLIAIRYRRYFNRNFFFLSAVVMGIAVLSFRPSYLGCHFTDALALFDVNRHFLRSDALLNTLYLIATITAAWLWLRKSAAYRRAALMTTGFLWLGTHVAAARFYRNSGDLNITAYHGIAEYAYQVERKYPKSQVYYDPEFVRIDSFSALRVLFFWPDLDIHALKRHQFAQLHPAPDSHILYFTTAALDIAEPAGVERGDIKLYDVTDHQFRQWRSQDQGAHLEFEITGGLPRSEIGERDHQRYTVRWLPRETQFDGRLSGTAAKAIVVLQLATNGPPRTAKLFANGEPAAESYLVDGNFWNTSPTMARFHVSLKKGLNSFRLTSFEDPGKLSDGREAAFLMIGSARVIGDSQQK